MSGDASRPERPLAWGHVNLNVTDLERSIAFYGALGFSVFLEAIPYLEIERQASRALPADACAALGLAEGVRARGCILQLGDTFPKLDLTELEAAAGSPPPRPPLATADRGLVRLCLASSDLASDVERLAGAGAEFLTPPREDERGLAKIALCRDPDGNLIELIQIDAAKWIAAD